MGSLAIQNTDLTQTASSNCCQPHLVQVKKKEENEQPYSFIQQSFKC